MKERGRLVRVFHWKGSRGRGVRYVFSARTGLPLPVRNERGEGRGEGHPTADTPTQLQARPPSSPQPSPPSAGGEGEETGALNTYGVRAPFPSFMNWP
ncbi:MAG TPA: hypothetical protein VGK40_04225 [Verrucomicrobiae bacterium]